MLAGVRTWVSWLLILCFSTNEVPRGLPQCRGRHTREKRCLGEHGGFGYSRLPPGRGGGQLGEGRLYLSTGSFAPLPTPPQNEACVVVPWLGECLGRGTTQAARPPPRDHCHHHKQQRGEGAGFEVQGWEYPGYFGFGLR